MEDPVGWRFVAIGVEGDSVLLGGVDAWSAPWTPVGDSLTVPHPQYPEQRHRFTPYSVKTPAGVTAVGGLDESLVAHCSAERQNLLSPRCVYMVERAAGGERR